MKSKSDNTLLTIIFIIIVIGILFLFFSILFEVNQINDIIKHDVNNINGIQISKEFGYLKDFTDRNVEIYGIILVILTTTITFFYATVGARIFNGKINKEVSRLKMIFEERYKLYHNEQNLIKKHLKIALVQNAMSYQNMMFESSQKSLKRFIHSIESLSRAFELIKDKELENLALLTLNKINNKYDFMFENELTISEFKHIIILFNTIRINFNNETINDLLIKIESKIKTKSE